MHRVDVRVKRITTLTLRTRVNTGSTIRTAIVRDQDHTGLLTKGAQVE